MTGNGGNSFLVVSVLCGTCIVIHWGLLGEHGGWSGMQGGNSDEYRDLKKQFK